MHTQYFQNGTMDHLVKPVKELMELNAKMIRNFNYFNPSEIFNSRRPEEMMERNMHAFIKNTQATYDYMHNVFTIMEKNWFAVTANRGETVRSETKQAPKTTKTVAKKSAASKFTKTAAKKTVSAKSKKTVAKSSTTTPKKSVVAKSSTTAPKKSVVAKSSTTAHKKSVVVKSSTTAPKKVAAKFTKPTAKKVAAAKFTKTAPKKIAAKTVKTAPKKVVAPKVHDKKMVNKTVVPASSMNSSKTPVKPTSHHVDRIDVNKPMFHKPLPHNPNDLNNGSKF